MVKTATQKMEEIMKLIDNYAEVQNKRDAMKIREDIKNYIYYLTRDEDQITYIKLTGV